MHRREFIARLLGAATVSLWPFSAESSQNSSDTPIRIGNITPYSGPASALGEFGKVSAAYIRMVNATGGVNGRRLEFLTYDDGYVPSRTVEQARRLVENDDALVIFSSQGTAHNAAIQRYLNSHQVPQLFLLSGAARFNDPDRFPWTMGFQPTSFDETALYSDFLRKHMPTASVAILSQNDDFGREYLDGFRQNLSESNRVVSMATYQTSDPTIDSQIVGLKASGADVLIDVATPKFAAQSIRRCAELDWKPAHILVRPSSSLGAVLRPAGLAASQGILSSAFTKDPSDPQWKDDPGVTTWSAFMDEYCPDGDRESSYTVVAYCAAQTLIYVLQRCGGDLSRANVMKQASNVEDLSLDMLLPGVHIHTSPTNYSPIRQLQMKRFDGERWQLVGGVETFTSR